MLSGSRVLVERLQLLDRSNMPVSIALGVVAAMGSAVAYGSFAVPIKNKRVLEAKVIVLESL